jgi:hypothetical protein
MANDRHRFGRCQDLLFVCLEFSYELFDFIPSEQVHEEMLSTISGSSEDNLLLWHSLSVSHNDEETLALANTRRKIILNN